jgi:hypothetical protein
MKKKIAILALVLAVGLLIGYFAASIYHYIFRSAIEQKIKTFYELLVPGSTVEVLNLNEQSGVYKMLIKINSGGTASYQEGYITKDGKLLSMSDSTILVENSINQMEKQKNFVNCLYGKGVKIFGISNQTVPGGPETISQLNILGRIYSPKLFVSCDGQLVQQCINAGISQVPSAVVGGNIDSGIKTIDWFQNKTGCKL